MAMAMSRARSSQLTRDGYGGEVGVVAEAKLVGLAVKKKGRQGDEGRGLGLELLKNLLGIPHGVTPLP